MQRRFPDEVSTRVRVLVHSLDRVRLLSVASYGGFAYARRGHHRTSGRVCTCALFFGPSVAAARSLLPLCERSAVYGACVCPVSRCLILHNRWSTRVSLLVHGRGPRQSPVDLRSTHARAVWCPWGPGAGDGAIAGGDRSVPGSGPRRPDRPHHRHPSPGAAPQPGGHVAPEATEPGRPVGVTGRRSAPPRRPGPGPRQRPRHPRRPPGRVRAQRARRQRQQ